jgi:putative addiction module killer protein
MAIWFIEYWHGAVGKHLVEKWLDTVTGEQFTSVAKEIKILEATGNELKLPHSRALSNGLFELRERRFGYRIYYCFGPHNTIILLAAGDKQSQEKDIKTARERLAIA